MKRKYDVVFYYPQHFNRGENNENQFFKHLLLSCDSNNISYIVFEEPDFTIKSSRNSKATQFDFIYLVVILLRKLFSSDMTTQLKDQKIGSFIAKIFFRQQTKDKHYKYLFRVMINMNLKLGHMVVILGLLCD